MPPRSKWSRLGSGIDEDEDEDEDEEEIALVSSDSGSRSQRPRTLIIIGHGDRTKMKRILGDHMVLFREVDVASSEPQTANNKPVQYRSNDFVTYLLRLLVPF
ncbi:hypothetical protein ABZP36_032038 [Zizania latifolia]